MPGIVSLVVHRRNVSFENEHSMDDQMRFAGVKSVSRIGPLTPQISPLRCAPVEMTKGRAALPATVVAEQDPFFITSVETFPRKGPLTPQISPLRCAPVEMTKGRAALPATVVAEQEPFFHHLCRNISKKRTADTADLSATLRSGR